MEIIAIEKTQFDELLNKLEKITKLLALNIVNDCKTQKDKILLLSSFGYGVTEISQLLSTSVGTVNIALVRSRKEKIGKKAKSENTELKIKEEHQTIE